MFAEFIHLLRYATIYDGETKLYIMRREYAENELQRQWTAVIITIRYDTRCYFNVRSKANMSQLNLPHGTDN